MNLPLFWRRASYTVAEAAEILCLPQDTLRTWMAREPTGDFLGTKNGGRISLSGNDLFFYGLLSQLTEYGVPVRTAMHTTHSIVKFCTDRLPVEKFLVVQKYATFFNFSLTDDVDIGERTSLVIPLQTYAARLIDKCAEVYVNEVD